jgi:hypothetical protein
MAVQRFVLNSTTLDNTGFGLGGGAAFILDSSALDSSRVLDGGEFLTVATAASTLGGLANSATATVVKVVSASAALGGLVASAQAKTTKAAVAVASLGGLDASATTKVAKDVIAAASLGGLDASATTKVKKGVVAVASLGGLDASATAQASPPAPPPVDDGVGYLPPYPQPRPRPRPKPKEIPVEINEPKKPRLVSAVGSSRMGGAVIAATGLITFSILDDDAEVLLLI